MTEDEMVGQCHRSYQHEFNPTLGGSGGRALVHGVTKSQYNLTTKQQQQCLHQKGFITGSIERQPYVNPSEAAT